MKTLGSILLVIGLITTIVGIGQAGSISCNCPLALGGQASNCQCLPTPQQQMGLMIEYAGVVVSLCGAGIIFISIVRKSKKRQELK
jgi:hypothetical protein